MTPHQPCPTNALSKLAKKAKAFCVPALLLLSAAFSCQNVNAQNYVYQKTIGSGMLSYPNSVAVDSGGNVYVADSGNNQIVKFDLNGQLLWAHDGGIDYNLPQKLYFPLGIALDNLNNVYVANTGQHTIVKYSTSGAFLNVMGGKGTGAGQFDSPFAVKTDSSANLYVADTNNDRVQKFDASGVFLQIFGGHGSGDGQLWSPQEVSIDSAGKVYVGDVNNARVEVFNSNGSYASQFGNTGPIATQTGGTNGIAFSPSGVILVSAPNIFESVQKYNFAGAYLGGFGSYGTGNMQFTNPEGMAFDASGNLYVADSFNNRIQVFLPVATNSLSSATITRSPFRYVRATQRYVQTVTVKNTSGQPLAGPISLVLESLSPNASLYHPTGTTVNLAPIGSPYMDNNAGIGVDQQATFTLEFVNPSNQAISYTPNLYTGAGNR